MISLACAIGSYRPSTCILYHPPFHDHVDRFNPEIHSEVVLAGGLLGLLAGDRCLVIFPSALVKGLPRSKRSTTDEDRSSRGGPLTKRYVLPLRPPKDMEEMLA